MTPRVVFWLRLSYWAGAILDVLAGLLMVFPSLFAYFSRLDHFNPGKDYRYAMGMGAPLMFGWTVLLLWADRKPVERRGILLITLIPVTGLVINQIIGIQNGFIPLTGILPSFVLQAGLYALYLFSYFNAQREQK
jgi:hypothetical protein